MIHKLHKAASLGLGLLVAISPALNIHPALAKTKPEPPPTTVTFHCPKPESSKDISTTLVWVPNRRGNIALITWQSEYFAPREKLQQRCEIVTEKFQKAFDRGQLKYLTTGIVNKYNVVCGVAENDDKCNAQNQLFNLKPTDDPAEALGKLIDASEGKESGPLREGGGEDNYFDVEAILYQTGNIKNKRIPKSRGAGPALKNPKR
jgi:hypothetical protein